MIPSTVEAVEFIGGIKTSRTVHNNMYEVFSSSYKLQASIWKAVIGVVVQPASLLCVCSSQQNLAACNTSFALGGVKGLLDKWNACE